MKRKEVLCWASLLTLLVWLSTTNPTIERQQLTHTPAPTRVVSSRPAGLVKSKVYVHNDEIEQAPPRAPQTSRVGVAHTDDETFHPTWALPQNRTDVSVERRSSWPAFVGANCTFSRDLLDSVLDSGGDPRHRTVAGIIALYARGSSRAVADVGSESLHSYLALHVGAKEVVAITASREFYESAKIISSATHDHCGHTGYLGDREEHLDSREGFEIVVAGSTRHAEALVHRIIGGTIAVSRHFIVAQPSVSGSFRPQRIIEELVGAGWAIELSTPEIGLVIFRNPHHAPDERSRPSEPHATSPPSRATTTARTTYDLRDGDVGDFVDRSPAFRSRNLLQLGDSTRVVPKSRPELRCLDVFAECRMMCRAELLCGSEDGVTAAEQVFPNARATTLLFRVAVNTLPASPFALFLAATVLSFRYTQRRVIVLGCYPSLLAAALGGVLGNFDRVTVLGSDRTCDIMRNRARGSIRSAVSDAGVTVGLRKDAPLLLQQAPAVVLTTTRMLNMFPDVTKVKRHLTIAVLGTAVDSEPLRVDLGDVLARFDCGVGMTLFSRNALPESVTD